MTQSCLFYCCPLSNGSLNVQFIWNQRHLKNCFHARKRFNFILPKVHGLVNIVLCCDQRRSIVIKSIIYHLDHIWYPHTCNIQRMILHSLSFNLWFLDTRGRGICWSGDRTVVWPPPTHPSTPDIHWCELPVNGG